MEKTLFHSLRVSMASTTLLVTSVLILAGCSQTKQLKEMHDSTASMNDTTREMNTNMQHLKDSTSGLCDGSTQALSLQARQAALIQLDNQATTPADKLSQAVVFVEAFDFQASPLCSTTDSMVDRMLDDASLEFYQVLQRYDSGSVLPNPLLQDSTAKSTSAKDMGFSVFGAAMHRVNRMQLEAHANHPEIKVYSILSLTEKALLDGEKVDKGQMPLSQLKQYEIDILSNRALAIKALQARHNMISAAVVGFGQAVKQPGAENLLHMGLDRYNSLLSLLVSIRSGRPLTLPPLDWQFDVTQYKVAQMSTYTEDLRMALETRSFLRSIGVTPILDKNLKALLLGMRIKPIDPQLDKATPAASLSARNQYLSALKQLQTELQ